MPLFTGPPRGRDLGGRPACGPLADEALCLSHRLGTGSQQGVDDGGHAFGRIGGDLVHEPDPESNVGAEPLAGEEPATSSAGRNLREDERGDDRGDDPEPHLGEAEDGVLRGDRNVRARDEPAPSAQRVAVHLRDNGSRTAVDYLAHAVEAHGVLNVLLIREVDRRALPLDVRTGAEAFAVAGEDDRAGIPYVGEGPGELGDQCRVEGVPPLWARKSDAQDFSVSLDAQRAHVIAA